MIDIKVNFTDMAPDGGCFVIGKTEGYVKIEGTSKVIVAELFSMLHALERNKPEELMSAIELLTDENSSHIFEMNKPE